MNQKALDEVLNREGPINVALVVNGVNTQLTVDTENDTKSISTDNWNLHYDSKKLDDEPRSYIENQLTQHLGYLDSIGGRLSKEEKRFNESKNHEREIDFIDQFRPRLVNLSGGIVGCVIAPSYWIRGKTLRGSLISDIKCHKIASGVYSLFQEAVESGRSLFESLLDEELSEETRTLTNRLITIQTDIAFSYRRLSRISEGSAENAEKLYRVLTGGENPPPDSYN